MKLRNSPAKPKWTFIASEAIRKVRFHRAHKLLEIQFADGEIYRYENVSATEFNELLNADSAGAYVNQIFKPAHPHDQVI